MRYSDLLLGAGKTRRTFQLSDVSFTTPELTPIVSSYLKGLTADLDPPRSALAVLSDPISLKLPSEALTALHNVSITSPDLLKPFATPIFRVQLAADIMRRWGLSTEAAFAVASSLLREIGFDPKFVQTLTYPLTLEDFISEVQKEAEELLSKVEDETIDRITEEAISFSPIEGSTTEERVELAPFIAEAEVRVPTGVELPTGQGAEEPEVEQLPIAPFAPPEVHKVEPVVTVTEPQKLSEQKAPLKLNINKASAQELEKLPGVGKVLAERIVEYRVLNGPFTSPADLLKVKGLGKATLERILPYIDFGE